jgi:hypothetical protein
VPLSWIVEHSKQALIALAPIGMQVVPARR